MIAEVIPAKRGLPGLPYFSYEIPSELEDLIRPGTLVKIPLRSKLEFGLVKKVSNSTSLKNIKKISSIVSSDLLTQECIDFLEEISQIYNTSLGQLVKTTLPPLQIRKLTKLTSPQKIISDKDLKKPSVFVYKNEREKKDYFKNICSDGQTLILVPEEADTKSIFSYLSDEQKKCSTVITSYISDKELFTAWSNIWSGEKRVIIGTRRALFLSFHDLRRIIIDNEGHPSHKNWDSSPRIHVKDAAFIALKHFKCEIILTSHSPTIETYFFTKKEIYQKIGNGFIPQLQVIPQLVNMKREPHAGNFGPISIPLQESLENHNLGSVFLYCHRKGSSSYVTCRDCGDVLKCKKCERPTTYHESSKEMVCHLCSYREPMRSHCYKCGGINLAKFGSGTESIVKEVKKILPNKEVIQIEGSEESLKQINFEKNQIIVGTQLAWSHINWKKLSIMAFMDADTPLFVPEYQTSERVWQSVFDAGFRLSKNCDFFIQTSHPDHSVYSFLTEPSSFYELELQERKIFGYPPYQYILKLFYGSATKESGNAHSYALKRKIDQLTKTIPDIKISQPIEMFPPFKNGKYWKALIVKLPFKSYKQLSREVIKILPEEWKVDPNPNTLLSI